MADDNKRDEINEEGISVQEEVVENAEVVTEEEAPVNEAPAEPANPVQEEAKKNPNPYEFRDVEAAVKVLMKPNIAKVLSTYKVDINDMLPELYEKNPVLENETIEQYALRCIDTGFALGLQENYKNIVVEKHKDAARQTYNLSEEPQKSSKKSEERVLSPEMMEMYQKAAEAQRRIVMGILALPFIMLEKISELNQAVMTLNEDGVEMTELTEEEAKDLANYMQKAKAYLNKAMTLDKVDTQTIPKKEDEETLHQVGEDIETIYETKHQEQKDAILKHPFSKEEFENAFLSKAETPEMKEMFEELGINDPKAVVDSIYNNVKSEPNEELEAYVMRTMEDELRKRSIDEATRKAQLAGQIDLTEHTRPAKFRSEKKKHELPNVGKDNEKENDILKTLKQLVTLPYEIFKTIMTGKLSEEQKKDEKLVNLKDKMAVLSPEIRKELYDYQERITNAMKQVFGNDYKDPKKSEEIKLDIPHNSAKIEGQTSVEQSRENEIFAERNIPGRRYILGANQRTGEYDESEFNKLLADFEKLDLSDTIAAMAWVSDFAIITKNTGRTIDPEIRAKMVEKFNEAKCYTDKKYLLPEFDSQTIEGRRMHVLTEAARAIAGDYDISTKTMLHAESVIAREDISLAHTNLILGPDAYKKDEPQVGTEEFTTNDALHQEEINKLLTDFDTLDFNDKQGVLTWMAAYGALAANMEHTPNIAPEQKAKMAAKFKEYKISTLEGAENLFSNDKSKTEEMTNRLLAAGAHDILGKGQIRQNVLDDMGTVLPENVKKEFSSPLSSVGVHALQDLVSHTLGIGEYAKDAPANNSPVTSAPELVKAISQDLGKAQPFIAQAIDEKSRQGVDEQTKLDAEEPSH